MRENKNFSQPLLEIFLLGRFRAEIDGAPIGEKHWTRRSAKSLVKMLAFKPHHALRREQMMELLWAEHPTEAALNNLNKAIHAARRAFEPDLAKGSQSRFILTPKDQIILASPGSLRVDLDEFERFANYALNNNDVEAGRKAIELYQGDLLVEDIYEDWAYARRESMRILFRKTATKIAELSAVNGSRPQSIEILKKLVAEDSSDEHAQRLLMRLYAETNSKYQALKQFERCRAALHALGIQPEPETIRLERSIKRGEILPTKKELKSVSAADESAAPIVVSAAPRIMPLTFHNGFVKSAHFLPDGETIVFSAAWDEGETEIFSTSLETADARRLGIKNAQVFSVSAAGEMAATIAPKFVNAFSCTGTLTKLSAAAADETSRKLFDDMHWAEWHPSKNGNFSLADKRFLAVVRDRGGNNCLEYPVGNVICETSGWISHPRFSDDGKKLAFIEHPLVSDDAGFVVCLDLEDKSRRKQILTDLKITIMGLAWANDEIWFTASRDSVEREICAVNRTGEERKIYGGMGRLTLRDVAKSGKALVSVDKIRHRIAARHADEGIERDLSWHDWTLPRDLTDDGETVLFEECGISGAGIFAAYVRKIDGSAIKKIGEGSAIALSPDGKHALLRINKRFDRLVLAPIGAAGEVKPLATNSANSLVYQPFACFFPDGKRILFAANEPNRGRRIYLQEIDGGKPVCFTPGEEGVEMFSSRSISPDGKFVVLNNSENTLSLYPTSGGAPPAPLKNLEKGFTLVRWSGDGQNLFIRRGGELPTVVYKYNLASGQMQKWLELMPKNPAGVNQILRILLTPDGKTYAYSHVTEFSDLYLMENLG